MVPQVSAFADDALGTSDAVGLAARLAAGEVAPTEVIEAAIARAEVVGPRLNGLAHAAFDTARLNAALPRAGFFAGVPTLVKDNADLKGQPTNQGSAAYTAGPARRHGAFVRRFLQTGVVPLGKSRLPEFGFNASTEYADADPVPNPWHTAYSAGASSGGSAAYVAAGVVPIAHANDGGGSIRIPAAACGLVGLKPTRGRTPSETAMQALPVRIIYDGILSRTVRDTAAFYRELEKVYRPRRLAPIGDVTGPERRRLRIGYTVDSVVERTDAETAAVLMSTVELLESLGHRVEEVPLAVGPQFIDDFSLYWAMLSFLIVSTGTRSLDRSFDRAKVDNLTRGLYDDFARQRGRLPGAIRRLRRMSTLWVDSYASYDALLSPTLSHTTPRLGYIAPSEPFDVHFERLRRYVGFTPLQNVTGDPAISLPLGRTTSGLPVGMQIAAAPGDERTLLSLAFEIEQARPWPLLSGEAERAAR
ncbi:amidase [Cumulibacter manganitolerans]|uniref:amidase n=1 Tax=Cumulibacter manganitolerans TaxID=1884992 RepID=UPI001297754C|nr:amidase [Cumulibacter manganitolerans]